ncbi:MAG TPA: undecaprenyl-diphosphate phosphatase [Vicinamibacteria bacterium]|jgi:undecaprenyl-diphosphatase
MTTTQAIVLGIVQGLGEFLPISSSGHLIVVPWLLGWPDHGLAFDVALHLGTLAAVLFAFARDWVRLVSSAVRCLLRGQPFAEPEARLLWLLALASVPGAIAGLLLDEWAETTFRSPALVAATMALMGAVLLIADRRASPAGPAAEQVTLKDALLVGFAQALAIVPGVSRSGSTISAALFLRYRREEAARFSFLLATPITAGAALVKVPHLLHTGNLSVVLPGMVTAAVFGFLAIRVLLAYVRGHDYVPFVVYRFAFAALVVAVLLARR